MRIFGYFKKCYYLCTHFRKGSSHRDDLPRAQPIECYSLAFAYSEGWQSDRSRWTRNPVYPFRVSGV